VGIDELAHLELEVDHGMKHELNQRHGQSANGGNKMATTADETRLNQEIAELELRVSGLTDERDALKDVAERYKNAVDDLSMAYAIASDGLEHVASQARALMADYRAAARERSQTITAMVQGQREISPAGATTPSSTQIDALLVQADVLRSRLIRVRRSPAFTIARILRADMTRGAVPIRKQEFPHSVAELTRLTEQMALDLQAIEAGESYQLAQKIHRKLKQLRGRRLTAK